MAPSAPRYWIVNSTSPDDGSATHWITKLLLATVPAVLLWDEPVARAGVPGAEDGRDNHGVAVATDDSREYARGAIPAAAKRDGLSHQATARTSGEYRDAARPRPYDLSAPEQRRV